MMRKVDNLGRITLPMALRRIMDISPSDNLEIFLDEDRPMLRSLQQRLCFDPVSG